MKKKRIVFFCVIVTVVAALLCVLCACNTDTETELEKMKKAVTFQHTELMSAKGNSFEVTFSCGVEEENYTADGAVGNIKSFARLELMPLDYKLVEYDLSFTIVSENGEISGDMIKNPLGMTFSAQIEDIDSVGMPDSITIIGEGIEEEMVFESRTIDFISAEKALEIAMTEFSDNILTEKEEGAFEREIMIKLIHDDSVYTSSYMWYVSFIAGNYDYWAVVIDPLTQEILSKKA